MIPSLLCLLAGPAMADDPAADPAPATADPTPADDQDQDPLVRYRTRFDALVDRTIGTTSVPIAFDWRHAPVQVAADGSFLVELNNFDSVRTGGMVRLSTGHFLIELGGSFVKVWDTPSSRELALTPYRQPGRPTRLEIDATGAIPLAEGVVTAAPRIFPAVQMVFNGYVGARYLLYPTGFAHMKAGDVVKSAFAPTLSEQELDNLEGVRPAAMQVDLGRYGIVAGLGDDLYLKPGLVISPRFLMGVPLLAPVTETDLLVTADLSLALGVVF